MLEIVTLSITSYRFAIGGEHYYGRFEVKDRFEQSIDENGKTWRRTRSGFGVERHPRDRYELKRVIDAKEALYLNKKDRESYHKSGDETIRFNDVESIIKAATEIFPTLFDPTDVLLYEAEKYSDKYEVLVAPDDVRAAITGQSQRVREEWLMANEYLLKEPS